MEKCANCKREIESGKLVWHETMCKRTMKYCEECQDVIEIEEYDEHMNDHLASQINSEIKTVSAIEPKEDVLTKEDSMDSISCIYCGLLVALSEYEEHENYCGEIHEECVYCNEEIRRKHKELHEQKCMLAFSEKRNISKAQEQIDDDKLAKVIPQEDNSNNYNYNYEPINSSRYRLNNTQDDLELTEEEQLAILYSQFSQ